MKVTIQFWYGDQIGDQVIEDFSPQIQPHAQFVSIPKIGDNLLIQFSNDSAEGRDAGPLWHVDNRKIQVDTPDHITVMLFVSPLNKL